MNQVSPNAHVLSSNDFGAFAHRFDRIMTRSRRVSCFDASRMPIKSIRRREFQSYSVHYSLATRRWIATIHLPNSGHWTGKPSARSFPFDHEKDAKKFAKLYTPPKLMAQSKTCTVCSCPFGKKCSSFNCRNCGHEICGKCSVRWGVRMVLKTYLNNPASLTVRVCASCNWLSIAFSMALLQGNYESAIKIHSTGNVNLRCTFADINKEAMFPIHCAVMGGNLDLVSWLVEAHSCPLSVERDPESGMLVSIQTSKSRTLIDLAMSQKPKVEVLSYLMKKNLSVVDTKDPRLVHKAMQMLLSAGFRFEKRDDEDSCSDICALDSSCENSIASSIEDACVICCERQMDCVLSPCGHQICCRTCGESLTKCPICKTKSKVLRVFKL